MTKKTFKDYIKQYTVHAIFPLFFGWFGGLLIYIILKDKDIEAARFFGKLGFYIGIIYGVICVIRM